MEQLIPVVNKLQDVFSAVGHPPIDLPQMVVIGCQSGGKSSVIENIVGREFLPRGNGVVTRRPLVLQLHNLKREGTDEHAPSQEWGEFLHLPRRKFFDFDEIRNEIKAETERVTGKNKGISAKTINLKIYSPHVLNLTLVDLPGITKVPVGDQPADIEEQVREMCYQYISNPQSIILAVTAANTDLANSDALKLARELDPDGWRTIGILTKLDLMDPGTDATDMLQGRVIPLRRGFVGVVNRSQEDINNHTSIREALEKESRFFQSHPVYRASSATLGTQYLSKMLNGILMQHIRDCLPEIKGRINTMVVELSGEIETMGESTAALTSTELGSTLLHLVGKFAEGFDDAIEGRTASDMALNELHGGARIAYILREVFVRTVEVMDPFDGLTNGQIRTAVKNAGGTREALFVPEVAFEMLAKSQISRLERSGLECAQLVFEELLRITHNCEPPELTRFCGLRDRVVDTAGNLLREYLGPAQKMISNLIKIELAHININHPDFVGGSEAVALVMEQMDRESSNSNSERGSEPEIHPESTASRSRGSSVLDRLAQQQQQQQQEQQRGGRDVQRERQQHSHSRQQGSQAPGSWDANRRRLGVGAGRSPAEASRNGNTLGSLVFGEERRKDGALAAEMMVLPQVPTHLCLPEIPEEREHMETEIIKTLISSYFNIVRKNFLDLVPKTIMCFLVNQAKDSLQNEMIRHLYREDLLPELLRETDDIAQRRQNCNDMRDLLNRALSIVNETTQMKLD